MKHAVARFFCGQCEMQYIITVCREKIKQFQNDEFCQWYIPEGYILGLGFYSLLAKIFGKKTKPP